jgi:hypothetical protein
MEEFYDDPRKQNRQKIVLLGMRRSQLLGIVSTAITPRRRREALKRRLSILLATAMMLSFTVVATGPASALPPGNNGNHYGEHSPDNKNNGHHNGAGAGMGKFNNERRGLR